MIVANDTNDASSGLKRGEGGGEVFGVSASRLGGRRFESSDGQRKRITCILKALIYLLFDLCSVRPL